jgi:hypothetical protein
LPRLADVKGSEWLELCEFVERSEFLDAELLELEELF